MDPAKIFPQTSKFKASIELINGIDDSKFPLLLSRIIKKLHLKDRKPFSEEEEEQLATVLGVAVQDLTTVLDSSSFIFHQSAYFNLNAEKLQTVLGAVGVSESKTRAFQEVWEANERSFLQEVKGKTIVPYVLDGVRWQLHLQMAQSTLTRIKQPTAIFELALLSTDSDTQDTKKVLLELTHDELYQFYADLETIQEQLDALG